MRYRVLVEPPARAEVLAAFEWMREYSSDVAQRWYERLREALLSLEQFPQRCALAPESEVFEEEIRQLLFGKERGAYRMLFTIEKHTVHVLHVRHSARQIFERDDQ